MSLTELSRWSGAANKFGKRKLATIHLHDIMDRYPRWSHVIIKVSPTKKPVRIWFVALKIKYELLLYSQENYIRIILYSISH